MENAGNMLYLLSRFACEYENNLIPHFIEHYLMLGIKKDDFLLILNYRSPDNKEKVEKILSKYGIKPKKLWYGEYDSTKAEEINKEVQLKYVKSNDWILHTDLDEFHTYPSSLDEFIEKCESKGINTVQGPMLDRIAEDGKLKKITKKNIWTQFPLYADVLGEIKKSNYYKVMLHKGFLFGKRGYHELDDKSDRYAKWYYGKKLFNGKKCRRTGFSNACYVDLYGVPHPELTYNNNFIKFEERLKFDVKVHHFSWSIDALNKLTDRITTHKNKKIYSYIEHNRFLNHYKKYNKIKLINFKDNDIINEQNNNPPLNFKKNTVVYLRINFLLKTEIFIFNEIKSLKKYHPVVITGNKTDYKKDQLPTLVFKIQNNNIKNNCELFKLLLNDNVKIIHAQMGYDPIFYLPVIKNINKPVIISIRGNDIYDKNGMVRKRLEELFKLSSLFLARSNTMKNDLIKLGCPQKKIIVQHTGIDIKKFKLKERQSGNIVKFLTIGRFVEKKGIIYLLKAFYKLSKEHNNIFLTVIGKDSETEQKEIRDEILEFIKNNKIENIIKVNCIIPYDNIEDIYYDHHIFIHPSITAENGDREGLPNSLKEAMATGMPVISTNNEGIKELIEDGVNGHLINEKDIDGLYQKMKYLIENKDSWKTLGEKARKIIEKDHNLLKTTLQLEKIYDKFLM